VFVVPRSATGVCLVYRAKEKRSRAQTACTGEYKFQVASQEWNEELTRCVVRPCVSDLGLVDSPGPAGTVPSPHLCP
jgi:hypothetical protein